MSANFLLGLGGHYLYYLKFVDLPKDKIERVMEPELIVCQTFLKSLTDIFEATEYNI
jgi:hypothetical protein